MEYNIKEDPVEYLLSPKTYITTLVGNDAYIKLINHFGVSALTILMAYKEQYIKAGLSKKQVEVMMAVKGLIELKHETYTALKSIKTSVDMFEVVSSISEYTVEHFLIVILSNSLKVLGRHTISIGGTTGTVVDLKVLFSKVLNYNTGTHIVLAHNHPSGNLLASESDIKLTQKIKEGAKILDITLIDHLIVHANKYYSFADNGIL